MATASSETTPVSSTLGQWVEDYFDRAYTQPDLQLSATTLNETLAQDFTAIVNHDHISRQGYCELTKTFRAQHVTIMHSIEEILSWDAPDGSGGGCTAHKLHTTDTNRETGARSETYAVFLINVEVIDGKRKFFSLTEVFNTKPLK